MRRRTASLIGTIATGALGAACTSSEKAEDAGAVQAERFPPLDRDALQAGNIASSCEAEQIEARVEALIAQMTLEQKVWEMHGVQGAPIDGLYHAGGNDELGIPAFKMVDGPRGVRAGQATAFPVAMARGATWDPELERRVGLAIGLETSAKGGNVLLAPTINLLRHPGWGRAQETYSEDPHHMAEMGVAFIAGAQNHVLASAKHFAVNSVENTRFTMSANLDERTLREVYLPHFRRAVQEANVASVMSAYNRVNGTYCAENDHLLSDILKGDWEFSGFVESDWFAGTRSTVPSARAGLDIEMPSSNFYGAPLIEAVTSGEIEEAVIDESVRRILRQKFCFGLDVASAADANVVESAEHIDLALEVARKGVVLLKNAEDTLPLSEGISVIVLGSLADRANLGDRGSSSVTPSRAVTPLGGIEAIAEAANVITIAVDEPETEQLGQVAEADAAIVVVGLTYENEGEFIPIEQDTDELARGGDRADLALPAAQQALIERVSALARRTIVVMEGGSAITVRPWIERVDALLMAWYPGMEGGTAIAEILFGHVNPSGKLPVTFARSQGQLPPWDIESDEIDYGYFHGYRLLDRNDEEPEFPFGFGLSYTDFSVSRLELERETVGPEDTLAVTVDVENVGDRPGDEVVQLYVGYTGSAVERPERQLAAFRRVPLEPGEKRTVELEIPVERLAYYDSAGAGWVVEPIEHTVYAGTSSRALPLEATFRVQE